MIHKEAGNMIDLAIGLVFVLLVIISPIFFEDEDYLKMSDTKKHFK